MDAMSDGKLEPFSYKQSYENSEDWQLDLSPVSTTQSTRVDSPSWRVTGVDM